MPKTRPPYPDAFRREATNLVRVSGRSIAAVAGDLGVSAETLRLWVRQAEIDAGRGRPGERTTSEREELSRLRRQVRTLELEREILKRSRGLRSLGDPVSCYQFIRAPKACFPVALACRVLAVSRAGYYAWVRRGPSARDSADEALTEQIRAVHVKSRATYGAPRIQAA